MRIKAIVILPLIIFTVLGACKKDSPKPEGDGGEVVVPEEIPDLTTVRTWLVDKSATEETTALFYKLKVSSKTKVLFGHQDDTKRGYSWENEQDNMPYDLSRSDVKEVTGAYPAVYGHDFIHIANFADGVWFDYEKQIARDCAVQAYNRGGVNTFCWHYANPVSKGSFYWNDSPQEAVSQILPGGAYHEVYKKSLKEIADFAQTLIGADGKLVPIIFRPFHEFDGDWFWWGKAHCTAADYKSLYQFTVTYLRDELGVHNFLYAWSPDRNFTTEAEYLERYPGDAFVDFVGMDNYEDMKVDGSVSIAANKLKIISDYAKKQNKLAALTETGLQNLTKKDWYTQTLLKALKEQKVELAYAMVWTNTPNAFWTPYKGHASESDFIKFKNDAYIMFGDKIGSMYKLK